MATTYDGINYFPIAVNFMEENAMEVIEAKYGMKGLAIVLKLLCKIYKEGYYIPWGEEQCLIFANKTGKEADAEEVQGIIEIMIEKGMMDRGSYAEHKVLTSEAIQKVWIEATKRRKRNWTAMPYLLIKPKETCNEEKTVCTQNVEQDAGSDAKNACNTEQSKVKQSKEFPPSAPPRGKEEEVNATPVSMPGYAFNTMTHNYVGLMGNLERFGITDEKEIEAILRLSDYGRKGTPVWKLICSTNWSNIGAKGKYMIAALNRAKKRSGLEEIYGLPDSFFREIDASIKSRCRKINDVTNYLFQFQGFSQDLLMLMSNVLKWKFRMPSIFKKTLKAIIERSVNDILTKNDWKDDGVRRTCVEIRKYRQSLGYSPQWMTEYVYHLVMLAKKEPRPKDVPETDKK